MPSFQRDGLGEVDARRLDARCRAMLGPLRHACGLVEFLGGVDQRLGGDAADVEAGAAGLDGLDDDGVDAELAGANGADITAGAGADDEKLADDLFHGISLR